MKVVAMMGRVVHFEIPAEDMTRAGDFYRDAFGWEINELPGMGYSLLNTTPSRPDGMPLDAGAINGGMLVRDRMRPSPIITIEVESIDEALAKVEELGGRTLSPKEAVADMGFSAYFADSEGNVMGLWEDAG